MSKYCILLLLALLSLPATEAGAQKAAGRGKSASQTKTWGFSVTQCLTDTTIYLSAVQEVEGVTYAPKTGFANERASLARQLELAVAASGLIPHPTTALVLLPSKDKAEKKYIKLRRRFRELPHTKLVETSEITIPGAKQ